jgi:hypothetical protein
MRYLKTYERVGHFVDQKLNRTEESLRNAKWLRPWVKNKFGDYQCSVSVEDNGDVQITIYYSHNLTGGDTWVGIGCVELEEILNFSKYLKETGIIHSDKQFKFQARGQFLVRVTIYKNDFNNNSELMLYRDIKNYDL